MTIDVIDLRDFYSQRLGIVARRLINRGIQARWPDAEGQRVLGLGYPTPYLGLFREDSERCIAFMPAAQGVLKWPTARPTLATLVDEFSLPLPDAAVDRILLVHALEMSDDPEGLLREVWRVLAPSGRMMAVIPNRRGVWTRTDNTPFGHGRPYSRSQITQLLRQTWFTPTGVGRGAVRAAGRRGLVPAFGDGVGARRRGVVAAVRRRSYRRSHQAGLSRDPGAPRTHAADSVVAAGAGAIVVAAMRDMKPKGGHRRASPMRTAKALKKHWLEHARCDRRFARCRLLVARIEIVARCHRRGHAFGARAVRPAATARRETFAATMPSKPRAAIDLRLRAGDEGGQAIDAASGNHRLRLSLRLRLELRLRAMLAIGWLCSRG